MDKKQNFDKIKKSHSCRCRPRTAKLNSKRGSKNNSRITPAKSKKSVNFSTKFPEIIVEKESTILSDESDFIKKWYYKQLLKRKMRELSHISMKSLNGYRKRSSVKLSKNVLGENRSLKHIVDRLAVNMQSTRDVLYDALRYGENQGVVRRLDYGPGESCWIFTPQTLQVNLCSRCSSSDLNQSLNFSTKDSTRTSMAEDKACINLKSSDNTKDNSTLLKAHSFKDSSS